MNSDTSTQIIQILAVVLVPIVIAVFALIGFLVYLYLKEKEKKSLKNQEEEGIQTVNTNAHSQNKQSIFNFMEFDSVKDNMIVQKNGNRYLMVIECQGINYDLMSGMEKTGVEEGFVQFLNTLRYPIQIYVQTR